MTENLRLPQIVGQGDGEKLSRLGPKAASALAIAKSIEEAAKIVGVSARTLRKWRQLPSFAARVEHEQALVAASVRGELKSMSIAAVAALRDILIDPKVKQGLKFRAATSVLDRTGHTPHKKREVAPKVELSPKAIADLAQAVRESEAVERASPWKDSEGR